MKVRTVSVLYATVALLISPAPARSAIEKVVGGGSVLQIRAMMACNHWEQQWQNTVLLALGAVA